MDGFSGQIAIGCDHAGFQYKEYIKTHLNLRIDQFLDMGTHSDNSMDYPDTAHPVAKAVQSGEAGIGILICGSGNGMTIVANKYKGVRCALCWNTELAVLARKHNDANIISLPARFISEEEALRCVTAFLDTDFEGGRHQRRVEKIDI